MPSDGLIEMDAGSWTGTHARRACADPKTWREVQTVARRTFRFPDGESLRRGAGRDVGAAIDAIARRHRRGRVAVATHGDIVRILIAHYGGAPLDTFQRIGRSTRRRSRWCTSAGGDARVLLVNDTGGLDRFGRERRPPRHGRHAPAPGGAAERTCEDSPPWTSDPSTASPPTPSASPEHADVLPAGAQRATRLVTVVVEKQQVQLLAASVLELLADLELETGHGPGEDEMELEEPVDPRWRAGRLSIGYDEERDLFLLEIEEFQPEVGRGRPASLLARRARDRSGCWATREQMFALSRHGAEVAERGRPTCQFCGNPMDPEGHACPAMNGHSKRD